MHNCCQQTVLCWPLLLVSKLQAEGELGCRVCVHLVGSNMTVAPLLQVSHTALNTSENILMCAPTGAGKTNVAMLSILHTMSLYRDAETGKIDTSKFKIVYVAPMKVQGVTSIAV
jgi:DEAD/DEAH box helicase